MRRRRLLRERRGLTLIETIAAIVVLAIAVPAMTWSLRQANVQRIDPIMTSRAGWLAMEQMEDIIADRYAAERGYDWLDEVHYPPDDEIDGFPGFSRTVEFSGTGGDPGAAGGGYTRVTVTVFWRNANAEPVSLAVETVLTDFES